MNRFKKACDDLAVYLNRDTKGLELLDKITRIGNETRKELASAVEAKAKADNVCKTHAADAARASTDASNARLERKQHLDTITSLRCKIKNYEMQLAKDEVAVPKTLEITPKELSRLLRDAMAEKQHHVPIRDIRKGLMSFDDTRLMMSGEKDHLDAIRLKDVVANLSYAELAKLGRLVAIYAIISGRAVVVSPRFSSLYDVNNPESQAVEMASRLMLKFLKPRCDWSQDEKRMAAYEGSESVPIETKRKDHVSSWYTE